MLGFLPDELLFMMLQIQLSESIRAEKLKHGWNLENQALDKLSEFCLRKSFEISDGNGLLARAQLAEHLLNNTCQKYPNRAEGVDILKAMINGDGFFECQNFFQRGKLQDEVIKTHQIVTHEFNVALYRCAKRLLFAEMDQRDEDSSILKLINSLFKLVLDYEPYNGLIHHMISKILILERKHDEAILELELSCQSYFRNRTEHFSCFRDMIFAKAEFHLRYNPIPDIYGWVRFRSCPIRERAELFMYAARYWLAKRNFEEACYPMEQLKDLEEIDRTWVSARVR
jgi:hypothetical protein